MSFVSDPEVSGPQITPVKQSQADFLAPKARYCDTLKPTGCGRHSAPSEGLREMVCNTTIPSERLILHVTISCRFLHL